MANMREVQENWTEITNRLLHDKEELLHFLQFSSNLYKLPFSNAALVYREKPDAMYIASAAQWNNTGRYVKPGEHGITVFDETKSQSALRFLFDVSQTDSKSTPFTWILPASEESAVRQMLADAHGTAYATTKEMCFGAVEHYLQNPRIQAEITLHMDAMRLNETQREQYLTSLKEAAAYVTTLRVQRGSDISMEIAAPNLDAVDFFKNTLIRKTQL